MITQDLHDLPQKLNLRGRIEGLVFASPKPIKVAELAEILGDPDLPYREIQVALDSIMKEFRDRGGGFHLAHDPGLGYQFRTTKALAPDLDQMFTQRPRPLSRAAQETLAIVAYRQPVTRADIEFIRGVDAGSIIKNLLDRDLIACVGRKEDSGRPMLFATTEQFLRVYNLSSLKDLPPLEAFQPSYDKMRGAISSITSHAEQLGVDVHEFFGPETHREDVVLQEITEVKEVKIVEEFEL